MYAIIRTGGKQAKVHEGDVLDIERVRAEDEISFTPLLIVDGDGNVTSDRATLATASVTAKVLGPSAGPKIDIFKYKPKSGNRRRQGHRQRYTRIEVTSITLDRAAEKKGAAAKSAPADSTAETVDDEQQPAPAKAKTTKKPPAKAAAATKPAAKSAEKPAAKTTGKSAAKSAKKPAAKTTGKSAAKTKTTTTKPAAKSAKKPAAKTTEKKSTGSAKAAEPAAPGDEEG